jgi:SAM-dependent methyltransferase
MATQAAEYGDGHAKAYDHIYSQRFATAAAVATLAAVARGGRLLELGVGTGRLAIPLAARGVDVDGIEASAAMIEQLQARPGASLVQVFQTDLDDFSLPRNDYALAICAVSTLFMLRDRAAQTRCLAAAAQHLRPSGLLYIEAFRPDPTRFDPSGWRVEERPTLDDSTHRVVSQHDPVCGTIHISHQLTSDTSSETYEVTMTYATETELDTMAGQAGLQLVERWHDWSATPATTHSTDPISVYRHQH